MRYERDDFEEVPGVPGIFYCPGCNASWEDHPLPSIGCPCDTHARSTGSLTADEVDDYLEEA